MPCRRRSAQATYILKKAGIEQVANLAGGMLRWRANAARGRRRRGLTDTGSVIRVSLKPGADRRARYGYPWVYSNEIEMTPAAKAIAPERWSNSRAPMAGRSVPPISIRIR